MEFVPPIPSRPRCLNVRIAKWLLVAASSLASIVLMGTPAAGAQRAVATLAGTLTGTATAQLSPVNVEGSKLIESGPVTGALSGSVKAELHVGASFTASFTIHTRNGSISGHGQATPHGSGRYQSFGGSATVTSGTGRYSHIHGHAGLYGTFDRRTDKVTIQVTGGHLVY
jgi:hypothetical protein